MKPVRFILHSDSLRAALRAVARWTPTAVGISILNYYISTLEKGVGQIRLLFLHCEGKSAALSLEGLAVGRVVDSAQKSTRYSSRDYSIVGKNLYLIFTVWP